MNTSRKNTPEPLSDDDATRYLAEIFRICPDEELLARYASGALTDKARPVVAAEISSRGLELPPLPEPEADWDTDKKNDDRIDLGDLQPISPAVTPTEALLLQAHLEACGIPAFSRDENLGQAFPLANSGLTRLLVPESCMAQALEIIDHIRSGAFALDENSPTDAVAQPGPGEEA